MAMEVREAESGMMREGRKDPSELLSTPSFVLV
jgi:hypothetical protein